MWGNGGIYGTWVDHLERFAAGEDVDSSSLPALKAEDLPPDGWERLGRRLGEAVGARLRLWGQGLDRGISEARDEFEVGRALTSARVGLRTIRTLATHPGLPTELGHQLVDSVDREIRAAQTLLEQQVDDARRAGVDPRRAEARLATLRTNALTAVLLLQDPLATSAPPAATDASPVIPWATDPGATSRRRLTFDRD